MITYDLPKELRRLGDEDGHMACYGCGHEHSCGIYGCQIIKDAADELERLSGADKWISVEERLPAYGQSVIVARREQVGNWRIEQGRRDSGGWWKVYGSLVKRVEYWMPMPAAPEEREHETDEDARG